MATITLPEQAWAIPTLCEFRMPGSIESTESVFTGAPQRSEYPGDPWQVRLTYSGVSRENYGRLAAFWNHVRGGAHLVRLWDLNRGRHRPQGSISGTVTLSLSAAYGASQVRLSAGAGKLLPGDRFNVVFADTTRQLVEVYSDDGSGDYSITPPLRKAAASGSSIVYDHPYADFMLLEAPWIGGPQGFTVELREFPQ